MIGIDAAAIGQLNDPATIEISGASETDEMTLCQQREAGAMCCERIPPALAARRSYSSDLVVGNER